MQIESEHQIKLVPLKENCGAIGMATDTDSSNRIADMSDALSGYARLSISNLDSLRLSDLKIKFERIFNNRMLFSIDDNHESLIDFVKNSKDISDSVSLRSSLKNSKSLNLSDNELDEFFLGVDIKQLNVLILEVLGIGNHDPFIPAYDEAHNVITKALDNEQEELRSLNGVKLDMAHEIRETFDKYFEVKPTTRRIKAIINNIIEKPNKRKSLHLLNIDIINELLQVVNSEISQLKTAECYKAFRRIAALIIKTFGLEDSDYKFALDLDNICFDLDGVNFDFAWALKRTEPYTQQKANLPISYQDITKPYDEETNPKTEYTLGVLLNAERKTKQEIFDLAKAIAKKVLLQEHLDHTLMSSENLHELRELISKPCVSEDDFTLRQVAYARLVIIHTAVLINSGYSEKLAAEATGALIRKLNVAPLVFSFYRNIAEEEHAHHYDFHPVIDNDKKIAGKLYLGAPKLKEACGLKIILKPPRSSITEVIYDGSRGTMTFPDVEWDKGEEHILALIEIVIAHFVPILGTDIIYDRTKIAISKGTKTKDTSTGDSRRVNVTFLNKHSKLSKSMTQDRQSSFELQIMPESEFKVPKGHQKYNEVVAERAGFEENRNKKAHKKLGFGSNSKNHFISLLNHAIQLDLYNGSLNQPVIERSRRIAQAVNRAVGANAIIDPCTKIAENLIIMLSSENADYLVEHMIELLKSDENYRSLFYEFRAILIKIIDHLDLAKVKSSPNITIKCIISANKLATVLNSVAKP